MKSKPHIASSPAPPQSNQPPEQTGQAVPVLPSLDEFVGQSDLVQRVRAMIATCRNKGVVFPHALLLGPAGSGRGTMAHAIARELGVSIHVVDAEKLERVPDLAAIVNNLEEGDVLLIQKLARLRLPVAQSLEPAMRAFEFRIEVGEGSGARTMKLKINPFTVLSPVARESECDAQLRGAFSHVLRFTSYTQDEMLEIARRVALDVGFQSLAPETVALIARASKGSVQEAQYILTRLLNAGGATPSRDEARELLALYGIQEITVASSEPGRDFAELGPIEFEHLIKRLLQDMGFEAETTKASGDGGIDVEAVLDRPIVGGRYLFQCKRFAPENLVGSAALREFYGALIADRKAVKAYSSRPRRSHHRLANLQKDWR
jgi:Holliday junction resolvasome RuvABC ATP-dependent DNA helicase subunit